MKLSPDQKAGLLVTAIVHLAVIIVLLLVRIGYEIERENSFVLDFHSRRRRRPSNGRKSFGLLRQGALTNSLRPLQPLPSETSQ